MISWLTEELVALGHNVTLFGSGDSQARGSSQCGRLPYDSTALSAILTLFT